MFGGPASGGYWPLGVQRSNDVVQQGRHVIGARKTAQRAAQLGLAGWTTGAGQQLRQTPVDNTSAISRSFQFSRLFFAALIEERLPCGYSDITPDLLLQMKRLLIGEHTQHHSYAKGLPDMRTYMH